jgi:predicted Fe-Mo cluster-binding NifX family protein
VVIVGGIGARVLELFKSEGIKVISNVFGNEKEIIQKFLEGKLEEISKPCSNHEQ